MPGPRYTLAPGAKVRAEDFGLLFYSINGPCLYFVGSGKSLDEEFFQGEVTLRDRLGVQSEAGSKRTSRFAVVQRALDQLKEKGLIIER